MVFTGVGPGIFFVLKELNQRLKIIYRVCCYVLVVLCVIITSSIMFLVMRDLSQNYDTKCEGGMKRRLSYTPGYI